MSKSPEALAMLPPVVERSLRQLGDDLALARGRSGWNRAIRASAWASSPRRCG
jgi:hypothetical protein